MMVRFLRSDGRRKVGMFGKMSEEKGRLMIEKNIVEEYIGPWPPVKKKMKFNLKNLR